VAIQHSQIDAGVKETGALRINTTTTVQRLKNVHRNRDGIISREVGIVEAEAFHLILTDVPYLAGDVAERTGIPCVAISNFTWDYIYEPFLRGDSDCLGILRSIQDSYAKMTTLLRLPFGQDATTIRYVQDVPLIVQASCRSQDDVRRELGLPQTSPQPLVCVGMRGNIPQDALRVAAETLPDVHFLYVGKQYGLPKNVTHVETGPKLSFSDIMRVSDTVISKLGYGILASCACCDASLLFPPRTGFREDGLLLRDAARFVRLRELPLADFESGKWGDHLTHLSSYPDPMETLPTNGAEVCADIITKAFR